MQSLALGNPWVRTDKRDLQGIHPHIHPGVARWGPILLVSGLSPPEFPGCTSTSNTDIMNAIHTNISKNMVMSIKERLDTSLLHPVMNKSLLTSFCRPSPSSTIAGIYLVSGISTYGVMH